MSIEYILALATFAVTMTGTPGPNNIMLMASGANFGYVRTLPHILGITIGVVSMNIAMGFGLNVLFETAPSLRLILTGLCTLFLVYMAWKIAHAAAPGGHNQNASPMTVWQAAVFQWVNPKAWIMVLSAMTLFVENGGNMAVLAVAAVFAIVGVPIISLWTMAGAQIRQLLTNAWRLTAYNWIMAALLLLSLIPILTDL